MFAGAPGVDDSVIGIYDHVTATIMDDIYRTRVGYG